MVLSRVKDVEDIAEAVRKVQATSAHLVKASVGR
jgi:hypothetical protein